MSLHIALYEPEIPPNTGNIIRLCANSGAKLHLIHPLGFDLDTKNLRRAGLDYKDLTEVNEYQNYAEFQKAFEGSRIFACTTKGKTIYSNAKFQDEDVLLFGPETRGLPAEVLDSTIESQKITIPMQANSRSLNLSNSVAVILYEAWRQLGFSNADH